MHGFWRRLLRFSRPMKSLRLRESLGLGERRFVAVIEFETARFLIGGTASSLVLLSRLEDGAAPPAAREECETERIENILRAGRDCEQPGAGHTGDADHPTDQTKDNRQDRGGRRC
jgi:flagellar biogenesis protein FliO